MNGLHIILLEGNTVDGRKEYFYPESKDTIVIGRDANRCDIVLDPALRESGIGNEHLALRRSLGRYRLDLNTENRVHVDGEPAFEEQEITGSAELTLSDSVRMRVDIVDDRQGTVLDGPRLAQTGHIALRNRKSVRFLAVAVVVMVAASGWVQYQAERVNEALARAIAHPAVVSEDVIENATKSVYAVMVRNADGGESLVGTAWVAPNESVITNAHVAGAFDDLPKGTQMFIRSAAPPHSDHLVTGYTQHPGYKRFQDMLRAYAPVQKGVESDEAMQTIDAADVALLKVENSMELAPPLPLASRLQLTQLRAGAPVAFVGFPSEGLLPNMLKTPIPVSQKDELVRITDFFMMQRPDGMNQLIQHSLPATGGASGSPIVNAAGEVVAVLCAGNVVLSMEGRAPNAADINFAQRVDLVHDLVDGTAEEAAVLYAAQWQESLAQFSRELDLMLSGIQKEFNMTMQREVVSETQEINAVAPANRPDTSDAKPYTLEIDVESGVFTLLAVPDTQVDLDIVLYRGEEMIATDNGPESYCILNHRTRSKGRHKAEVYGYTEAKDVDSISFNLKMINWQVDPTELDQRLRITAVKHQLDTDAEPTLVEHVQNQELRPSKLTEGIPAYIRVLTLDKPGTYLFIAGSTKPADVDLLIVADGELLDQDTASDTNYAGLTFVADKPGQKLDLIALAREPGTRVELKAYHWPTQ